MILNGILIVLCFEMEGVFYSERVYEGNFWFFRGFVIDTQLLGMVRKVCLIFCDVSGNEVFDLGLLKE